MKKLFKAIRDGNIELVKQLVDNKPELANCVAKQPPKKEDGQSPLQVALKTGNVLIAEYLLDMGANVNFIEDESCCNSWRTPVIHDAINCAVMLSRWNTNDKIFGFRLFSDKERADAALKVLKRMIDLGADVNAIDSFGNNGLCRYGLQACQILPAYDYVLRCEREGRVFTDELHEDLKKVLTALKDAGADIDYYSPNFKTTVGKFYSYGSIGLLFDEVFGKNR